MLDEARATFSQAIALNGSLAEAYNARGNVYWNLAQPDAAIADFGQAIQLDPQLYKAYRNRAGVWWEKNDLEKAIADCSAVIALNIRSWRDYVMRGDLYYELKQYDKARGDYVEGVRRAGQDLAPTVQLVSLLTHCPDESYRDPEQAIRLSQTACQIVNWRDFRALELLAASYAAAGNFDQAIRWQEQALQIVPPDASAQIQESLRKRVEQYRESKSKSPAPGAAEASPAPVAPEEPGASGAAAKEPTGT
jgi:tetratricopeptide (TPR) repeat protein